MTLRAFADTLASTGKATLTELAADLRTDRESVTAAAAFWQHKGRLTATVLRPVDIDPSCGPTCKTCPIAGACSLPHRSLPGEDHSEVLYEWVG
jgi:hypothetical protein